MIRNTAFYVFFPVATPEGLRAEAFALAESLGLRGTLLIAKEGLNGYLAGEAEAVKRFEEFLSALAAPQVIEFKRSESERVPFRRLLVRVKPQILTFRTGQADPLASPGERITPTELAAKIEAGQAPVLIDCRNRFEALYGTFQGAEILEMDSFDEFPEAYAKLEEKTRGREVVMFCTGGIRCEKASSYLKAQGHDNVRQLHGGVLKYFEETGGVGWDGNCFVFDERIAVRKDLSVDTQATREIEFALLESASL